MNRFFNLERMYEISEISEMDRIPSASVSQRMAGGSSGRDGWSRDRTRAVATAPRHSEPIASNKGSFRVEWTRAV